MSIPVIKVPGIGPKTVELLEQQGIKTVESLIHAGIEKLVLVPGISRLKAMAFIEAANNIAASASAV